MSDKKHSFTKAIVSSIIALILLSAAGWVILNRQYVVDLINYNQYHPSDTITSFAATTTMNTEGKFLFYSAQPSVEDQDAFNKSCPNYSPDSTAILGCYDGQKIYIYDITDSRLNGIRDETAAYEMLHAAYKRITGSDKTRLDSLIEAEYKKQATPETASTVAYFAKYEPGQRDDELFSVIATQYPSISPDLEAYYSRYFTNRQALVTLYNQYSSVFTNLKTQSDSLYSQLTTLSASIESRTTQYDADSKQLSADIASFNARASSGGFSSTSDFDSERDALVTRSNQLDAERQAITDDINTYNTEYTQYQTISNEIESLNNSINSIKDLNPAPSV
jgi:chaperonin cofactor prefoldin